MFQKNKRVHLCTLVVVNVVFRLRTDTREGGRNSFEFLNRQMSWNVLLQFPSGNFRLWVVYPLDELNAGLDFDLV